MASNSEMASNSNSEIAANIAAASDDAYIDEILSECFRHLPYNPAPPKKAEKDPLADWTEVESEEVQYLTPDVFQWLSVQDAYRIVMNEFFYRNFLYF